MKHHHKQLLPNTPRTQKIVIVTQLWFAFQRKCSLVCKFVKNVHHWSTQRSSPYTLIIHIASAIVTIMAPLWIAVSLHYDFRLSMYTNCSHLLATTCLERFVHVRIHLSTHVFDVANSTYVDRFVRWRCTQKFLRDATTNWKFFIQKRARVKWWRVGTLAFIS